jgi:hypothetical protein
VVTSVTNPQGVEYRDDGTPFVWLGSRPIELLVLADHPRAVTLAARADPGPAFPPGAGMRFAVRLNQGPPAEYAVPPARRLSVPVTLAAGENRITIGSLVPTRPGWVPPAADPRDFIVRMSEFQLACPGAGAPAGGAGY